MGSVIYEPKGRAREYAALAANLYRGCAHGCRYCYAPAATFSDPAKFREAPVERAGVLAQLGKDCRELRGTDKRVLLSFTTDTYQPLDDLSRLTRSAIVLLHENGLSVEVLTKGGSRAQRDFDLLGAGDAFATTMTFLDPAQSLEWEPGAALPADRIETIKAAHVKGIETWVSLEPVIDPAQSLEIIRQTHSFVDLYKVGVWNHDARAKMIDWAKFGREAVALLDTFGKRSYIKADLRKWL